MNRSRKPWWSWAYLRYLLPLITISVAIAAIIASGIGVIALSIFEQIVLALLGLLAIDSSIERLQILEQISRDLKLLLGRTESQPSLMWETEFSQLSPFDEFLKGADELFVSGGHLLNLLSRQREPLRRWLGQNKKHRLKLILESPDTALKSKTPIWSSDIDQNRQSYAQDIRRSLTIAAALKEEFPGQIKVRLTDQVPSLTVMMADRQKATVCLNLYMAGPEKRPVFELSRARHPEWFALFEERYPNLLWREAKSWEAGS